MNIVKKVLCLLLILALCAGVFAGCSGDDGSSSVPDNSISSETENSEFNDVSSGEEPAHDERIDVLSQKEKITVSIAVMTGFNKRDSLMEKRLEEKYNIDIDLRVLPRWSDDSKSTINLWFQSDDIPNIMWWWEMDDSFQTWKKEGKLMDVSKYLNTYTNIRDYYNKMNPDTLFFATEADGAVYRLPGDAQEPSCEVTWVRQDWLDNLGLKVPTDLDELEEVLRAFTEDDPDGNGQNDTYGLAGSGRDFRSVWPWIQAYDFTDYSRWCVDDTAHVGWGPAQENTKEWLSRVASLYEKGYIIPDITTDANRDDKMAKGGFGVIYSWCSWNNPDSGIMTTFYHANPGAQWVPIAPVRGPNGTPQEDPTSSAAWAYFGFTQSCGDNLERIFAIYDDLCATENYIERRYGDEGEHYVIDDGVYRALIAPDSYENEDQNIGLNLFHNLVNRKDEAQLTNLPATTALYKKSGENSRTRAAHLAEWQEVSALTRWNAISEECSAAWQEYAWNVIGGSDSIDNWDAYIAGLNELGLEEATTEAQQVWETQYTRMKSYFARGVNGSGR